DLRILDFVDERLSRHHSQVPMFPSVVCGFEQRIGHQLLRAFAVREHPLAAHEERGLDAVRAQTIDDATLIAGAFGRLLAKIACEARSFLWLVSVARRRTPRCAVGEYGESRRCGGAIRAAAFCSLSSPLW